MSLPSVFVSLWNWSMGAKWRHWIAHFVIGFALSFLAGCWPAAFFYLAMGIQDTALDGTFGGGVDWVHKAGDVLSPALAALLAHRLGAHIWSPVWL